MTSKVICSVVIVNWKSIEILTQCIESIKKNTSVTHEIIVIDNNSGDDEQNDLAKLEGIKTILNKDNKGFGAACNQGFRIAQGRYVFILNPDTFLVSSAIDTLVEYLEKNSHVHAAAPKLIYGEDKTHHPSIKYFVSPLEHFVYLLPLIGKLRKFWENKIINPDKTQCVDCVWGAAIMLRQEVLETIGYFDERFFMYSEELDLCRRMAARGMKLIYYPDALVAHYGGRSQAKSSTSKERLLWTSKFKYFEKHYSRQQTTMSARLHLALIKFKVYVQGKKELKPVIEVLNDFIDKQRLNKQRLN